MILFVVSKTLMMPVFLNFCHPSIKFTMEIEKKGQLPFLDVLLSKQSASDHQGSFITSVYRLLKTYTGLLTNYFSFTPFNPLQLKQIQIRVN